MAPPGLSVWARAQRTLATARGLANLPHSWLDEGNPRMAFSVGVVWSRAR